MKATKETPSFEFDENSDLPLWVQLRNRMAYLITSGFYKPGDKLPTVRKYAADLRIAYNTVSKVYRDLERDGLIRTKQGSGSFVTYEGDRTGECPDAAIEATVRGSGVFVNEPGGNEKGDAQVNALAEDFIKSCLEQGMAYEDIPKLVSACVRRMKRGHENQK